MLQTGNANATAPSLSGKREKSILPPPARGGGGSSGKKEKTKRSKKEKKRRGIQVCSPEFSLHDPSMNYMLVAADPCAAVDTLSRRTTTSSVAVKVYDASRSSVVVVSTPVVSSAKKKLIARRPPPLAVVGSNQKNANSSCSSSSSNDSESDSDKDDDSDEHEQQRMGSSSLSASFSLVTKAPTKIVYLRKPPHPTLKGTPETWYRDFQEVKLRELKQIISGKKATKTDANAKGDSPNDDEGDKAAQKKKEKKTFASKLTNVFTTLGTRLEKSTFQMALESESRIRERHEEEAIRRLTKYFPDTDTHYVAAISDRSGEEEESPLLPSPSFAASTSKKKKEKEEKKKDQKEGVRRHSAAAISPSKTETFVCSFDADVMHHGCAVPSHLILTDKALFIVGKAKSTSCGLEGSGRDGGGGGGGVDSSCDVTHENPAAAGSSVKVAQNTLKPLSPDVIAAIAGPVRSHHSLAASNGTSGSTTITTTTNTAPTLTPITSTAGRGAANATYNHNNNNNRGTTNISPNHPNPSSSQTSLSSSSHSSSSPTEGGAGSGDHHTHNRATSAAATPKLYADASIHRIRGGTRATQPDADDEEILELINSQNNETSFAQNRHHRVEDKNSEEATGENPALCAESHEQPRARHNITPSASFSTLLSAAAAETTTGIPITCSQQSVSSQQTTTTAAILISKLITHRIPLEDIATYAFGIAAVSSNFSSFKVLPCDPPTHHEQNRHLESKSTERESGAITIPDGLQLYITRKDDGGGESIPLLSSIVQLRKFHHEISNVTNGVAYMMDGKTHVTFVERFACYFDHCWRAKHE